MIDGKMETQNKCFDELALSAKATKKFSYMGNPKCFFEWLAFKRGVCDLIECFEYKGLTYFIEQKIDGKEDKNYCNISKEESDIFICFNMDAKDCHAIIGV